MHCRRRASLVPTLPLRRVTRSRLDVACAALDDACSSSIPVSTRRYDYQMEGPLRLSLRELSSACDAATRMHTVKTLEELSVEWASVLDHLEKVWVKTGVTCRQKRKDFDSWNRPWAKLRSSDPLLKYLVQARHADNHSTQELASFVTGYLIFEKGKPFSFSSLDEPELAIDQIRNRGVKYTTPDSHLGNTLNTRDPRRLAVHACHFYGDYLYEVRRDFLGIAQLGKKGDGGH